MGPHAVVSFPRRLVALLGALLLASSSGSGSGSAAAAAAAAAAAPRQASTTSDAGHAADRATRTTHLDSLASDLNECSVQASTCLGDDECLECMTSYVDHPLEYDECMADYDPDWPSATACDVKAAQPCCFDLVSRGSCLESGLFLEYWGCWFEAFVGCLDYELTCSGAEDTSGGGSGGSSGSGSGGSSSSVPGDVVVEEAATEGSGAAGRAVAPSQTHAVAVASGLAGILAASALLLL